MQSSIVPFADCEWESFPLASGEAADVSASKIQIIIQPAKLYTDRLNNTPGEGHLIFIHAFFVILSC